jgi:hypothetical protein
MCPACALLIASFALAGCGARKVQPLIVRETVTVRQPAAAPAPPAIRRTVPAPQSAPRNQPQRNREREEVGVTGLAADVPPASDAGRVAAPEEPLQDQPPSPSPVAIPENRPEGSTAVLPPTAREHRRTQPALLLAWVAIAAALCGWGFHLRRDAKSRRPHARRAA